MGEFHVLSQPVKKQSQKLNVVPVGIALIIQKNSRRKRSERYAQRFTVGSMANTAMHQSGNKNENPGQPFQCTTPNKKSATMQKNKAIQHFKMRLRHG
ncbi:MAG: hypothetical protein PHX58_14720, partial [Desulfovibrio sp.]|nr:hypothetical protein [Desulfovibrio sp.]